MRKLLIILILLCFGQSKTWAQLYFPNEQYFNTEVERYFNAHPEVQQAYNSHLSLKPVLDNRSNSDSIYFKDSKHYYWITQKLFKENFLIFEGDDFWCSVDPIIDLEGGIDAAADSTSLLYWNTRGLRVQAKFLEKVSFSTVFYENQALVPEYLQNYVNQHGELVPNAAGYKQVNAVIPGYARTKSFKTNGYDFAFAEGNVAIVANKWLNFQFGNGNQFIGNGYRSLLLSDFTVNYPYAKIETNLWDGRIQYNAIYALHQNLYRLPAFESVEATYERKIGTYHYLDFALSPNFQIGIFEGAQWKRTDSAGTHKPNLLFTNPLPFVNGIIMGQQTTGYNAVFGMNLSYRFKKNRAYSQLVLDNQKLSAVQIGIKSLGQFVEGLDVQLEYNYAATNTYIAQENRYNYSHYNLPMAHPLSSGFNEGVIQLKYEKKGVFVSNKTIYYNQKFSDSLADGTDIISDNLNQIMGTSAHRNVFINQFECGYRLNKNYNLQAVAGWMFREEYTGNDIFSTSYIYVGIRTRLRNKTLDF